MADVDRDKVNARKAGRAFADEVLKMIACEFVAAPTAFTTCVESLRDWAIAAVGAPPDWQRERMAEETPMTDVEARRWREQTRMKRGEHDGQKIADVPYAYLFWLRDDDIIFRRDLRRYLASDFVTKDREQHGDR